MQLNTDCPNSFFFFFFPSTVTLKFQTQLDPQLFTATTEIAFRLMGIKYSSFWDHDHQTENFDSYVCMCSFAIHILLSRWNISISCNSWISWSHVWKKPIWPCHPISHVTHIRKTQSICFCVLCTRMKLLVALTDWLVLWYSASSKEQSHTAYCEIFDSAGTERKCWLQSLTSVKSPVK